MHFRLVTLPTQALPYRFIGRRVAPALSARSHELPLQRPSSLEDIIILRPEAFKRIEALQKELPPLLDCTLVNVSEAAVAPEIDELFFFHW